MKCLPVKGMVLGLVVALLALPLAAQQASAGKSAGDKVNLNTATSVELQKLPGVGPSLAQRIVDFRKDSGPFKKVEDLLKVKGIGEKTFNRFKDMLTI